MALYFIGFIVLVIGLLALDLGVFHRKDEVMSTKAALGWTIFWIVLALLFNGLVYVFYDGHWLGIGTQVGLPTTGKEAALAFFTAYLVEKSLSVDNIFVIAMVFNYFKVPGIYQHRVLFWGILGALIMRGVMIAAGIAAISYFTWLTYVLGGLLIVTAIRMMVIQEDSLEPEKNLMVRVVEKWFPISKQFLGHSFFVKVNSKWAATPLFLALVLIESTDLLFAVDSIPAVLAITLDPFIVFTSNVFAILGMRSLYFALASMMDRFRYLKSSLVFILAFVGTKMILAHHIHIDSMVSLAVIIGILMVGVAASLLSTRRVYVGEVMPSPLKIKLRQLSKTTAKTVRRVFFLVAGVTVLLIGAVMIFLPGPGLLIMLLGLALLAVEFVWARVWMKKVQSSAQEIKKSAKNLITRKKKPIDDKKSQ